MADRGRPPPEEIAHLRAANDLTLRLNIVKVGLSNGTLVVTGEHLVTPESDVRGLLQLSTQLVLTAVHLWHQLMLGNNVFGEESQG